MSSDKIKVLEIIDEAKIGGGQIHLYLLSKYLDKNIFDVFVACEPEGFLIDELNKINIPVIPVLISNKLKLSSLIQLISIFKQYNFDIIHTHGGTAGFWGRLATIFLKNKPCLIHTFHGIHYLNLNIFKKYLYIILDRLLSKITDKHIFVCDSDYKKAMKHKISPLEKNTIVYNGIELEKYLTKIDRDEARRKYSFNGCFVYGNIGRLHKQKGQEFIIRAFSEINKKYPDTLLAIIGDGELKDKLIRLSKDLGVLERVKFFGPIADIVDFLNAIDVFVLPSLWEGQPLTLFEAMAVSKPIISTSVDGVNEILDDKINAILCRPADINSLYNAMEKLYSDREFAYKIANQARKTILNSFDARTNAENISKIYISLRKKIEN